MSKRRKGTGRESGRRKPVPAPPLVQPPAKAWWKRWPIAIAAGVGGILALIGAGWNLFGIANGLRGIVDDTTPQIRLVAAEQPTPFTLPFAVDDRSDWFDLRDVSFNCYINWMRAGNMLVRNSRAGSGNIATISKHAGPVNFACPISKTMPITELNMTVQLGYSTLWFRRSTARDFNWIAGRWVEGPVN